MPSLITPVLDGLLTVMREDAITVGVAVLLSQVVTWVPKFIRRTLGTPRQQRSRSGAENRARLYHGVRATLDCDYVPPAVAESMRRRSGGR